MQKFSAFFTKNRKKKGKGTYDNIPFNPFPTQVYRHYEFDSDSSAVRHANTLVYDFENKLKNASNLSEENSNFQPVFSDSQNISPHVTSNSRNTSPEESRKSGKNIYVVNIRNCRNFHVGSKKTISAAIGHYTEKSWSLPVGLNWLLDSQQKISEESIVVISLNLGNNWKKFGASLGFKENYLEELKYRSDENTIIMTYDLLQKYISLFPNTSIGFIVNILNDLKEIKIIGEIAKTENLI